MSPAISAVYDRKWVFTERAVNRIVKWKDVRGESIDELMQLARIRLWQQCRKVEDGEFPADRISGCTIARSALAQLVRFERGSAGRQAKAVEFSPLYHDRDRPELCVVVDGVRLTMADAVIDYPKKAEHINTLMEEGIDAAEMSSKLGVSRQRVSVIAERLGGLRLPGGTFGYSWVFPANAKLPKRPKRRRRHPRHTRARQESGRRAPAAAKAPHNQERSADTTGEEAHNLIRTIERRGYATEWHQACPEHPRHRVVAMQDGCYWFAANEDPSKAVRSLMQQLGLTGKA